MPSPIMDVVKLDRCTECRTCEIACSFHHAGCFDPTKSSIRAKIDKNTAAVSITLYSTCDGCSNEEEPMCSLFCPRGVFTHKAECDS